MLIQILGGVYVIMGLFILFQFSDHKRIGDLYGGLSYIFFGIITIVYTNFVFLVFGYLMTWVLRIGGYDHLYSKVKYEVPDNIYSLSSLFDLITNSVNDLNPNELKERCLNEGMWEINISDVPSVLDYDERYTLSIKTDNREVCWIEILGSNNHILQVGVQISYREIPFFPTNLNEHYFTLEKLFTDFFGSGNPSDQGEEGKELVNYVNEKLIGYVFKMDSWRKTITFKIGNLSFFPQNSMFEK
jgi:hypothetical protein